MEGERILLAGQDWVENVESSESGRALLLPAELTGFVPPLTTGRATLLGGPPEIGKTALALQVFKTLVEAGEPGVFVTLEMTPADLFERFARQFASEEECKEWIRDYEAKVTHSYINPGQIEKIISSGEYSFAILDHLHELNYADRFQLENEVKRILSMAPEHDVALLALAQLRRPGEFQTAPTLHDWKDSGVFEQKAAVTLQLWKDPSEIEYDTVTLYNLKNRMGKKYPPVELYLDEDSVVFRRR